jgi:two-component system chemotaxis sensor kinase CheA
MLAALGEITVERLRVEAMLRRLGSEGAEALDAYRDADRLHVDLQQLVLQARMVPLSEGMRPLLRRVRDLARRVDKQVRLVTSGEDLEVDTRILERLREPLVHVVRNAVDHGIESVETRKAAGKDPIGSITVTASQATGQLVLSISDDGAGLDREAILARAIQRGIVPSTARLSPAEVEDLVFVPGLTTARAVTAMSGRGVGMDAVRRATEEVGGSASITSEPGRGTTITLRVPLTIAILDGLAAMVGSDVYVVPLTAVVECVDLQEDHDGRASSVTPIRDGALPCLHLGATFDLGEPPARRASAIVVQHEGKRFALVVDRLIGKTQIVVRPLSRLFHGATGLAASAVWSDGRVALVLDVPSLLRRAQNDARAA